jgi:hypothetical protein
MKNIERFNLYTAHIFGMLFGDFPVPRNIHARDVVTAVGVEADLAPEEQGKEHKFVSYTLRWLEDTGYIRAHGSDANRTFVLQPKAFEALNATLSALEGKKAQTAEKSVGERLSEVATDAGKAVVEETWKKLASEIVGSVIGHAAKAFSG